GAVNRGVTAKELCNPRFHTRDVRAVDESTKRKVCIEYGVQLSDCNGRTLEIDHLVSLELGGTNDEKNLWPEYFPEAKTKDKLENLLHRNVCAGKMKLVD